jgi:hypothetical protein
MKQTPATEWWGLRQIWSVILTLPMSQKFTETIHLALSNTQNFKFWGISSRSCQVSKNKVTPVIQDQSQVLTWQQRKTTADSRKYVYCIWHIFIQNVRKQQVLNITYITRPRANNIYSQLFQPWRKRGSKSYQTVFMYNDKTISMYTDIQSICIQTYSVYVYRQLTWLRLWHLLI